ncbi:MAG: hypothetical protein ACRELT_16515, partial [Longimicrobiales bacterium]
GGPAGRRPAAAGRNPNLPWYIAAGVLLLLLIVLVVPVITGRDSQNGRAPLRSAGAEGVPAGTPPPLTGTPRQQADRLFERIMTARERGDAAEAVRFAPMAIEAYAMAAPLDNDGLYHLASVHLVTGDYAAARATAEQILMTDASNLLGLGIAAEAADLAGDSAAARDYASRFLDAYDAEIVRNLPEYQGHARILPDYRASAQRIADE